MAEGDASSTKPLQKVNFGGLVSKAAKAGRIKSIKLKVKFRDKGKVKKDA